MLNHFFIKLGRKKRAIGLDYPAHTVFFAFSMLGLLISYGGIVYFNQSLTKTVLHDQVAYDLRKTEIMMQQIINIDLQYIKNRIVSLSNNLDLKRSFVSGDKRTFLSTYYDWSLKNNHSYLDMVIFHAGKNKATKCLRVLSPELKDVENICEIIKKLNVPSHDSSFFIQEYVSNNTIKHMLLFSKVLINDQGRAIGRVTGGTSLNDDSDFINRIKHKSEGLVDAIAIVIDGSIVGQSTHSTEVFKLCSESGNDFVNQLKSHNLDEEFHFNGEYLFHKHKFSDSVDAHDIKVIIALKNNPFNRMETEWYNYFIVKTIWFLLVAVLVAWLSANKLKKELKLLLNYSRYTSKRGDDQNPNFSDVREIKEIGHEIASMMASVKKSEADLQNACNELEFSLDEKRLLLRRVIEIQEQERTNLSSLLYEKINKPLSLISQKALQISIKSLKNRLISDAAKEIKIASDQIFKDTNREISNLKPLELGKGVLQAIPNMPIVNNLEQKNIAVKIHTITRFPVTSEKIEISIYRIIQEALMNVFEHSQCSTVSIDVYVEDKCIILTIQDNGTSTKVSDELRQYNISNGQGIKHMRDHTESLKGSFTFEMSNQGFKIQAIIPLMGAINATIEEIAETST